MPVTVAKLVQAREDLIANIVGRMPQAHRKFLLSIKRGEPDWALLSMRHAKRFPPCDGGLRTWREWRRANERLLSNACARYYSLKTDTP